MVPATATAHRQVGGLRLIVVKHSLLGTHTWYQQMLDGHPVLGGYLVRHVTAKTGAVTVDDGRAAIRGRVASKAVVSKTRAIGSAIAAVARNAGAPARADGSATLAVQPGGRARLVWDVFALAKGQSWEALVDATSGRVLSARSAVLFGGGPVGQVFSPNPVVDQQDESLTDQNNREIPDLDPSYRIVPLTHLDGSGYLHGDFATVILNPNAQAFAPNGRFVYTRNHREFEQTMAYYDVTTAETYIQSLGFTDVNNEPQDLRPDGVWYDNSFYSPHDDKITLGRGGVDDAEDEEVTWHEYGHAIQDDQVPNFGKNNSAGSIGEGFGDYWAFTMSQSDSPDTATTPLACIADWDSTSYTSGTPHCLRRVDTDHTYADYGPRKDVHLNGEIWSAALHDINLALGRDETNTIVLESQFSFTPKISFKKAAQRTVDAARALYGESAAQTCIQKFTARDITGLV
jgi:Zn-dependent metalloprotease